MSGAASQAGATSVLRSGTSQRGRGLRGRARVGAQLPLVAGSALHLSKR